MPLLLGFLKVLGSFVLKHSGSILRVALGAYLVLKRIKTKTLKTKVDVLETKAEVQKEMNNETKEERADSVKDLSRSLLRRNK